ncbi:MAG TPA: oligopeptide transporter, OPT family [Hyphomonadaceae bacterium]|nr:oligopeptide transporter, OPT family [Hyphomonadaceae bacterium]HPI46665.1 oligopeptide transporter, OPT family [Hyphomonadaceae bacterium]
MTDFATPTKRVELTIRAVILGSVLGVIFTAANVYLGLRVGLTFASAIPAAVISMALLRAFRTSTIWENMTVQTVASVGGAMSSIIFVLPALVMVGWWTNFPFWQSFLICTFGGILGVTFSIPLRRALVSNGNLPYPEGIAAAEVLKVGSRGADQTESAVRENKAGLITVIVGSITSALFAFLAAARLFVTEAATFFKLPAALGGGATGLSGGLSLALLGAGHLVGLAVGLAMLVGVIIAWGIAVPVMTAMQGGEGSAEEIASTLWRTQVRFIGAGAIGIAAIWTLIKLSGPLMAGVTSALAAQRARSSKQVMDITEQDIPINLVAVISLVVLAAIGVLLWSFTNGTPLAAQAPAVVAGGLLYVVVIGFIVAAVCGYMAGLIGSSNSPVSGVGILAIIVASSLMLGAMQLFGIPADGSIIAFALMITAVVFSISVISNDNLQDLKTGQLVGATPWRQQTALLVGVVAGSLVIPPILDLLNGAYGFVGGPPPTIADAKPLPAPQATLISALAVGVIDGNLRWDLIGIGAALGVVLVIVDEALVRTSGGKRKAPPLAVAMGIYLPMATTMAVVIGAVAGTLYDKWVSKSSYADTAKRLGVLLASGLIVGESLFGVFTAAVIVSTNNGEPFGLIPADAGWPAMLVAIPAFVAAVYGLYAWTRSKAAKV